MTVPGEPAADASVPATNELVRPGAALSGLSDSALAYIKKARADNTWTAYESDWEIFAAWCRHHGRTPLPADGATVADFLAAERDRGMAPSTVGRRVAAIRLVHKAANVASPHDALAVTETLRGVRAEAAEHGWRPASAEPLLEAEVRALVGSIETDGAIALRDRSLLLTGFDSAMRRSELGRLRVEDLDRQPEGIVVRIPVSKGDRQGDGAEVGIVARPGSPFCPVRALDDWLAVSGIAAGPVYRRVYKGGRIGEKGLKPNSIGAIVTRRLAAAGIEGRKSAHSLRHGLLTEAARRGADIFTLGDHSRIRNLDVLRRRYIHPRQALTRHPGAALLREPDR